MPAMAGIVTSVLGSLRLPGGTAKLDTCAVCGRHVREADARMRLPGGGWVHRGCATYRMRRREQVRRRARVRS
jgi:hypothetical protein